MRRDYLRMLDTLKEGVYFVDLDRKITFWNKGAERITGFRREEVLGSSCMDNILVHVDCKGTQLCKEGCPLLYTMKDGSSREAEVFLHHRRGHRVAISVRTTPLEDDEGNIIGGIELFSELNPEESLRQRMEELERCAMIDPLTGVPNRSYLNPELERLFRLWEANRIPFGLLFFDIDHFKRFNDTYGHDVGDQVLRTVAQSLSSSVRNYDSVGRWGGEEFVGFFPNANPEVLLPIAEKLRQVVRNSWVEIEGEQLSVTISIGGACPVEGDSPEKLLKRADSMMYKSKQDGRDRVTIG